MTQGFRVCWPPVGGHYLVVVFGAEKVVPPALDMGSHLASLLGKEMGNTSQHPMPIGENDTLGILNSERDSVQFYYLRSKSNLVKKHYRVSCQ